MNFGRQNLLLISSFNGYYEDNNLLFVKNTQGRIESPTPIDQSVVLNLEPYMNLH